MAVELTFGQQVWLAIIDKGLLTLGVGGALAGFGWWLNKSIEGIKTTLAVRTDAAKVATARALRLWGDVDELHVWLNRLLEDLFSKGVAIAELSAEDMDAAFAQTDKRHSAFEVSIARARVVIGEDAYRRLQTYASNLIDAHHDAVEAIPPAIHRAIAHHRALSDEEKAKQDKKSAVIALVRDEFASIRTRLQEKTRELALGRPSYDTLLKDLSVRHGAIEKDR